MKNCPLGRDVKILKKMCVCTYHGLHSVLLLTDYTKHCCEVCSRFKCKMYNVFTIYNIMIDNFKPFCEIELLLFLEQFALLLSDAVFMHLLGLKHLQKNKAVSFTNSLHYGKCNGHTTVFYFEFAWLKHVQTYAKIIQNC